MILGEKRFKELRLELEERMGMKMERKKITEKKEIEMTLSHRYE